MQPLNTWNMCMPVMPKNVAPNNGVEPGHLVTHSSGNRNGLRPSPIKWFHSIECRMIKVSPNNAVATIHLRAVDFLPCAEADTAITMVKLDDSSTSVITEEKTTPG